MSSPFVSQSCPWAVVLLSEISGLSADMKPNMPNDETGDPGVSQVCHAHGVTTRRLESAHDHRHRLTIEPAHKDHPSLDIQPIKDSSSPLHGTSANISLSLSLQYSILSHHTQ